MHQPYVIGIDIGTGSVKAVALNFSGEVAGTSQHFYPVSGKENEQDAGIVFVSFQQCIKEIISLQQQAPAAVTLSSAMHSVMAVDGEGKALTNAILWSDTRSSEIAEGLRHSAIGKKIYSATGTPLHAMSPLCKIKWLKQFDPAIFQQAHKFISIKEYIWFQLFGEYKIDYSIASATGLFNIHSLQWDETALSFIPLLPGYLSEPVSPTYQQRGMASLLAEAMDIPASTPFFIGGSDGCLANLGSLCLTPSVAALTIGTSAAVRVTQKQPAADTERMIFNYLLDEQNFICGGAVNNGGNVLQWLAEKFIAKKEAETSYGDLFALMETVPPGSKGLVFLPYLHGERAPIWDEHSCGVFFGIRSVHNRACFARAAIEGVCFALNEILSSLESLSEPIHQIKLSGGAAENRLVLQTLADITAKEIIVQKTGDASAIGAAYIALKALGVIDDYSSIQEPESETIQPVKENAEVYQKLFSVYQKLYPSLKEAMHLLHQSTTH